MNANTLLNEARKYLGVKQSSPLHHYIIDTYNSVTPRPVGYRVSYQDDWCDVFVTFVADQVGLSHEIGRECGVQRHIHIMVDKGIWLGRQKPQAGDIITWDWDGNGWADHIGFVANFDGNYVTTIEGNSNRQVQSNKYLWHDWRIKGYARPRYQGHKPLQKTIRQIAQEVIAQQWGNGQDRINRLTVAGYKPLDVQTEVNKLLGHATLKVGDLVRIKPDCKHWLTGEQIPNWVYHTSFKVHEVTGRRVVISLNNTVIGALLKTDLRRV